MSPTQSVGGLRLSSLWWALSPRFYPQHWKAVRNLWFLLTDFLGIGKPLWEDWPQKLGLPLCPSCSSQILPCNSLLTCFLSGNFEQIVLVKKYLPTIVVVLEEGCAKLSSPAVWSVFSPCLSSSNGPLSSSLAPFLPHILWKLPGGRLLFPFMNRRLLPQTPELIDADKALGGPAVWFQYLYLFLPSPYVDKWADYTWRQRMWLPLLGFSGLRDYVCGSEVT